MIYRNFRFQCIIRVLLLGIIIFLLFFTITHWNFHFVPLLICLLILFQIYNLIHYVEKTDRDLKILLDSIRYSDFTRTFKIEGLGSAYDEFKEAFNNVIKDFQKIRSEKEEQYHYLQNIIQHIGVCLIAFRKNGKVEMINNSAKKLFQINNLTNIILLEKFSKEIVHTIFTLKPGEKALVKVQDKDDLLQLAVYSTDFKLHDRLISLVLIQNIQNELEEQEMEAWQKLIGVLTHEIMNSITPISSISSTVNTMLKEVNTRIEKIKTEEFDKEMINDIQGAIKTIHNRSNALLRFVESYRNLTRIPKPNFTIFPVLDLFRNIKLLMGEDIRKKNIKLSFSIEPESIELTADEELVEQVLINLIKNSMYALEDRKNGEIELKSFMSKRGRIIIQIIDNGQGILEDVIDKIFIPFFTTKPKGSGIGLSLSKQILRLHGGIITTSSIPDEETVFTLRF